jgi:hypothetical protein
VTNASRIGQELYDTVRLEGLEPPSLDIPTPVLDEAWPRPLFTTADDYLTATQRMKDYRALDESED